MRWQLTDAEIDAAIEAAERRPDMPAKRNANMMLSRNRKKKVAGRRYEPSPQLRLSFD